MPHAIPLYLVLTIAPATRCLAASQPIADALQQEAMTCVGEAMQICPGVMTSEDHGLACMTGKRAPFSPRGRVVYDKVNGALGVSSPSGRVGAQHDRVQAPVVR
jgi:hypothetical protein